MTPSPLLRWITRVEPYTGPYPDHNPSSIERTVLQQWWHTQCTWCGEWRDIPSGAEVDQPPSMEDYSPHSH